MIAVQDETLCGFVEWMSEVGTAIVRRGTAACGNNSSIFYHENHSSLNGPCAVNDSLRDNETLSRAKFNGAAFQIDQQLAFDNVERLVVLII